MARGRVSLVLLCWGRWARRPSCPLEAALTWVARRKVDTLWTSLRQVARAARTLDDASFPEDTESDHAGRRRWSYTDLSDDEDLVADEASGGNVPTGTLGRGELFTPGHRLPGERPAALSLMEIAEGTWDAFSTQLHSETFPKASGNLARPVSKREQQHTSQCQKASLCPFIHPWLIRTLSTMPSSGPRTSQREMGN